MSVAAGEVRQRLSKLGKRRKKQAAAERELADDIREAVAAARLAKVPMGEAATRLGLNRTTLYQVYLDDAQPTGQAA